MLYRETIAVCFEIHAKDINALWAEHRTSVKAGGNKVSLRPSEVN
jgi:hypothetical protein